MKIPLFAIAFSWTVSCCGAAVVLVPSGGTTYAFDARPFLILYPRTIRYQQVCSASAFGAVRPTDLYLSRMTIFSDANDGIDIPRLQINLSTTRKAVDALSTNFVENVGPDDTVVFGPGECLMPIDYSGRFQLIFQRPFTYRPATGNLLVDVRVFEADHGFPAGFRPSLRGQNLGTDEMSRAYADDVTAMAATQADSGGFGTSLYLYPIPSLSSHIADYFSTGTNSIVIEWPTYPTVFSLQSTPRLGASANWQTVPNAGGFLGETQVYLIPLQSAGASAFYRLYWSGGP